MTDTYRRGWRRVWEFYETVPSLAWRHTDTVRRRTPWLCALSARCRSPFHSSRTFCCRWSGFHLCTTTRSNWSSRRGRWPCISAARYCLLAPTRVLVPTLHACTHGVQHSFELKKNQVCLKNARKYSGGYRGSLGHLVSPFFKRRLFIILRLFVTLLICNIFHIYCILIAYYDYYKEQRKSFAWNLQLLYSDNKRYTNYDIILYQPESLKVLCLGRLIYLVTSI